MGKRIHGSHADQVAKMQASLEFFDYGCHSVLSTSYRVVVHPAIIQWAIYRARFYIRFISVANVHKNTLVERIIASISFYLKIGRTVEIENNSHIITVPFNVHSNKHILQ